MRLLHRGEAEDAPGFAVVAGAAALGARDVVLGAAGVGKAVRRDMIFLRESAIAGLGIAMIPDESCTASVESGQLVRVLPRYRGGSGAIYLVWPSRKLVPAPVVAARELLIVELGKMYE